MALNGNGQRNTKSRIALPPWSAEGTKLVALGANGERIELAEFGGNEDELSLAALAWDLVFALNSLEKAAAAVRFDFNVSSDEALKLAVERGRETWARLPRSVRDRAVKP